MKHKPVRSPLRPPAAYRSARQRVAHRRRSLAATASAPQRNPSCGLLVIGSTIALALTLIMTLMIANRFSNTTNRIVENDPRHHPQQSTAAAAPDPQGETRNSTPEPIGALPDTLKEPFTVLLVGIDQRDNLDEGARSDTLIVVHVNPQEGWAGMLSIPRDSAVTIPHISSGKTKINVAYTYGYMHASDIYGTSTTPTAGGGALAAETVEDFLGINIDYIAQVDFRGFVQLVDMLGGVTVDVDHPLLDAEYPTENYGFERIYIPVGLQVLDGETALRYARSRHSGSDFDRSKRQQQVLRALLREIQRRGLLNQVEMLPQLMTNVEQSVSTTLPINDLRTLRGLASLARTITTDDILLLSINPNDVRVVEEAGSDIYWNQQDVERMVEQLLAGPTERDAAQRAPLTSAVSP